MSYKKILNVIVVLALSVNGGNAASDGSKHCFSFLLLFCFLSLKQRSFIVMEKTWGIIEPVTVLYIYKHNLLSTVRRTSTIFRSTFLVTKPGQQVDLAN